MNLHHTPDEIDARAADIAYAGKVGDADLTPVVEMLQQGAAALRQISKAKDAGKDHVAVSNAVVSAHHEHIHRMTCILDGSGVDPVEVSLFVRTCSDAVNRLLTAGFSRTGVQT